MSQVVELLEIGKEEQLALVSVRLFRSKKSPGSLIADSCSVPYPMDPNHVAEDNVLVVPFP